MFHGAGILGPGTTFYPPTVAGQKKGTHQAVENNLLIMAPGTTHAQVNCAMSRDGGNRRVELAGTTREY